MANNKRFLSVELDSKVSEFIEDRIKRLKEASPALEEIGEYQLSEIDKRFETETDPFGVPWESNSPGILAYKKKRGFTLKVLQQTGRMREGFKYKVNNNSLKITNSVSYAADHQYGIGVKRRQMVGFSPQNIQNCLQILDDYIRRESK